MRIAEYTEKNGVVYRDATAEEIAEIERQQAEMPAPDPTPDERIAGLEEALELILSGVTA